jgi:hypothetical protein
LFFLLVFSTEDKCVKSRGTTVKILDPFVQSLARRSGRVPAVNCGDVASGCSRGRAGGRSNDAHATVTGLAAVAGAPAGADLAN